MQSRGDLTRHLCLVPKISDFFNLGRDVLSEVDKVFDYKILKLSGGEIFLYDDIVNFIKSINKNYTAIQLLTNSLALTSEKIDQLAKLYNVYFQISLDGVSGKSNFARNGSNIIVKKVLEKIKHILKSGMGLEINCVLTKYNIDSFEEMLKHFKGYRDFVVVPRPVRYEPKDILNFNKDQLQTFKNVVIVQYELYSDILPPKKYIERLVYIMEHGHKNWNCYVPFYVLGVNNYGDMNTCTCTDDLPILGNIFDSSKSIDRIFKNNKNYIPASKPKPCSYCIIQYEMMNLYTEGLIDNSEMQKIPSFTIPAVMERVEEIKKKLIESGLVK
ncbi:MAG: radical SAM protein [Candidatus Anammoxibacter sp.]